MTEPSVPVALVAGTCGVIVVMTAAAILTKHRGKAAYVDAAWGASFVVAAWAAAISVMATGHIPSWRAWVLLALGTLWGLRLTWHLGRRVNSSVHDDPRYESFLGGPITSVPFLRVVRKVFALQAVLIVVVALPLVAGVVRAPSVAWLVVPGAALWLVGVIFEAVSDSQLAAYRADPERSRILTTGLWAWSRHPNYFGDFCVWWGFWLIGGSASGWRGGWITLLSPVLMSWILIGVSGVRLAEKRMQGRSGWTAYCARTPIFLPRPPVRQVPSDKAIRAE